FHTDVRIWLLAPELALFWCNLHKKYAPSARWLYGIADFLLMYTAPPQWSPLSMGSSSPYLRSTYP
ncbi:hypothetical protein ABEB36_009508, partial [Hypothenemus hampei]